MIVLLIALGIIFFFIPPIAWISPFLLLAAFIKFIAYKSNNGKASVSDNNLVNSAKPKKTYSYMKLHRRYEYSWNQIRKMVFAKGGRICENCGSQTELDIHHIRPLSLGGTNSIRNLVVLCRDCHEEVHNKNFHTDGDVENNLAEHVTNNYDYGVNSKIRSKKVILINNAIKSGKDIRFAYKKWKSDHYERRHVTPIELFMENGRNYLKSYCHLRNAERIFRLSRMEDITLDR